jgi:hypothetical protein
MAEGRRRAVRLRINASGRRQIGSLDLSEQYDRISDFLNSREPFLLLRQEFEGSAGAAQPFEAVLKDAITYVEALEEERTTVLSSPPKGAFQQVILELAAPRAIIRANIFVPDGETIGSVLNDDRRFISLRSIEFEGSSESYNYLAVGKSRVLLLKCSSA